MKSIKMWLWILLQLEKFSQELQGFPSVFLDQTLLSTCKSPAIISVVRGHKPVEDQNTLYRAQDCKEAFRYCFWTYKIHVWKIYSLFSLFVSSHCKVTDFCLSSNPLLQDASSVFCLCWECRFKWMHPNHLKYSGAINSQAHPAS